MDIPFPPPFLTVFEFGRLAEEFSNTLTGAWIEKVYLSEKSVLAVGCHLPGKGGSPWLCISMGREFPWLYLSDEKPPDVPASPPPFAALLRKYLSGGRIAAVRQPNRDRVLEIAFEAHGERGCLFIEMIGKKVRCCLTDEESTILGSLPGEDTGGSERGGKYAPPEPPRGVEPGDFRMDREALLDRPEAAGREIRGFHALLACELAFRLRETKKGPSEIAREMAEELTRGTPRIYRDASGLPRLVSTLDYHGLSESFAVEQFENLLEALGKTARELMPHLSLLTLQAELTQRIHGETKRLSRDLKMARKDFEKAEEEGTLRRVGEMLLAHPHRVKKGMQSVTLPDLYSETGEELTIRLDPVRTPHENAQDYFRKAAKAARTREGAAKRIEELEERLSHLACLREEIERAQDTETLENLQEDVREILPTGKRTEKTRKGREALARKLARIYTSADGLEILVAKGKREADELLRKVARGNDLWVHTRDCPGSHVIVRAQGKGTEVPSESLLDAAHLAAYFSKARGETGVPLYLSEVKHLRRPRKGPPGKVIVTQDRGFDLRVDEVRLERLLRGRV